MLKAGADDGNVDPVDAIGGVFGLRWLAPISKIKYRGVLIVAGVGYRPVDGPKAFEAIAETLLLLCIPGLTLNGVQ